MSELFETNAEKIFKTAGVTKADAPEMFEETKTILSQKMARLSATMGLSYKRLDAFREQEDSLVEDLKKLKADGDLR